MIGTTSFDGFSQGTLILILVTGVVMFVASIAYWLWVRNHADLTEAQPPAEELSLGDLDVGVWFDEEGVVLDSEY